MWGSIGGYVGIFLGVSFFQMPNLIYNTYKLIQKALQARKDKRKTDIESNEQEKVQETN